MALKMLIVYDSFFGNTENIAQEISQVVNQSLISVELRTLRVSDVNPEHLNGLHVLIVGSPTRGFRPTKPIMEFINQIPDQGLRNVKVAAFDTRVSSADVNSRALKTLVKVFGYATETLDAKLRKKGGNRIISSEGFFVKDTEGPLKEGEIERAANWARNIVKCI